MKQLAEMCSVIMVLLNLDQNEQDEADVAAWRKLATRLLDTVRKLPTVGADMEYNPELRHWYFTPDYVEDSFFANLLDNMRERIFWEELVVRMSENALTRILPKKQLMKMTMEEYHASTAAVEQAIWDEVKAHGIDRLAFIMPEKEN